MAHYDVFSGALVDLVNQVSGIPMDGYVDDFGCYTPLEIADASLSAFSEFCEILGVELKIIKSKRGQEIQCLGLGCFFPAAKIKGDFKFR